MTVTPAADAPHPGQRASRDDQPRRGVVREQALVLLAYVVAAPLAGVAWWLLWRSTSSHDVVVGRGVPAEQLTRTFDGGGWYFVVACLVSVLLAITLSDRLDADPLATTLTIAVCAAGAGWLMATTGEAFGPGPLRSSLAGSSNGDTISLPLSLQGSAFWFVWPVTAMLGVFGRLLWPTDQQEHQGGRDGGSGRPGAGAPTG